MKLLFTTTFIWTSEPEKHWAYDLFFSSFKHLLHVLNSEGHDVKIILFDNSTLRTNEYYNPGGTENLKDIVFNRYEFSEDDVDIINPEYMGTTGFFDQMRGGAEMHTYGISESVRYIENNRLGKNYDYWIQTDFDISFDVDACLESFKKYDEINKILGPTLVADATGFSLPSVRTDKGEKIPLKDFEFFKDSFNNAVNRGDKCYIEHTLPLVFPYFMLMPLSITRKKSKLRYDLKGMDLMPYFNINKSIDYFFNQKLRSNDREWESVDNRKVWFDLDQGVYFITQLFNRYTHLRKLFIHERELPVKHLFHLSAKLGSQEKELKEEIGRLLKNHKDFWRKGLEKDWKDYLK